MEYVKLGKTGLEVSRICLGCMTYGDPGKGTHAWSLKEEESRPLLKQAIGAVNETGQKAEMQTRAVAAGKANMVDVVTAVSETEVAIDAVVAVRDKIIAAYQDIMKMPI